MPEVVQERAHVCVCVCVCIYIYQFFSYPQWQQIVTHLWRRTCNENWSLLYCTSTRGDKVRHPWGRSSWRRL